jgi:hypothetical protein
MKMSVKYKTYTYTLPWVGAPKSAPGSDSETKSINFWNRYCYCAQEYKNVLQDFYEFEILEERYFPYDEKEPDKYQKRLAELLVYFPDNPSTTFSIDIEPPGYGALSLGFSLRGDITIPECIDSEGNSYGGGQFGAYHCDNEYDSTVFAGSMTCTYIIKEIIDIGGNLHKFSLEADYNGYGYQFFRWVYSLVHIFDLNTNEYVDARYLTYRRVGFGDNSHVGTNNIVPYSNNKTTAIPELSLLSSEVVIQTIRILNNKYYIIGVGSVNGKTAASKLMFPTSALKLPKLFQDKDVYVHKFSTAFHRNEDKTYSETEHKQMAVFFTLDEDEEDTSSSTT